MKNFTCLLIFLLAVGFSARSYSQNLDQEMSKFDRDPTSQNLEAAILASKASKLPYNDARINGATSLMKRILAFQAAHPAPTQTPSLNIAPGAGLSGMAPEGIADPTQRAAYQAQIQQNKTLSEEAALHVRLTHALDSLTAELNTVYKADESARPKIDAAMTASDLSLQTKQRIKALK